MQQKSWNIIEKILKKQWATLPLIVDRWTAERCMTLFGLTESIDWETTSTGENPDIYIYRKDEEKKHLSIENMRLFEREIRDIPYSGKSLYVLIDFDEATPEAMNAILKILEEPPEYARILLVVSGVESIIDTIRSRSLVFFEREKTINIDPETIRLITGYARWEKEWLLSFLYKANISQDEALEILSLSMRIWEDSLSYEKIEEAIIALSSINENPKYILDKVFL